MSSNVLVARVDQITERHGVGFRSRGGNVAGQGNGGVGTSGVVPHDAAGVTDVLHIPAQARRGPTSAAAPRALASADEALVRRALYPAPPPGAPVDLGLAPLRRASRSAPTGFVVAGGLIALLVLIIALVSVAGSRGTSTTPASPLVSDTRSPGVPPSTSPSTDRSPVEPSRQLAARLSADRPAVEALVGAWVPQVSSKRSGMVADGRTYDDEAIIAEHEALRASHSQVLLLQSGTFSTYTSPDFWVTVVGQRFTTAQAANAWCDRAGFAPTQCYAKLLSHTASPHRASVQRAGS